MENSHFEKKKWQKPDIYHFCYFLYMYIQWSLNLYSSTQNHIMIEFPF